jgi:hypothetical protein
MRLQDDGGSGLLRPELSFLASEILWKARYGSLKTLYVYRPYVVREDDSPRLRDVPRAIEANQCPR